MATFQELQTEVQTLLIDTPPATLALTPTWVNRAMRKLERKHNFKTMEFTVSLTTTAFTRVLGPLPTNWKQTRDNPYYSEPQTGLSNPEWEMIWTDRANAGANWGSSDTEDFGSPRALVDHVETGNITIWPIPDGRAITSTGEYLVTIPYFGYVPDLSAPTDTNWFTLNAEEWIVYQATANGFYANEDEDRAQLWETRATKEMLEVVTLDKKRRLAEVKDLVPHLGARRPHTQDF